MAFYAKTDTIERANILDSEVGLVVKTYEVGSALATNGVIAKGTPYPANDSTCIGFVFEDVDMSADSERPASIIVAGRIIEANIPVTVSSNAKNALAGKGIVLV